MKKPKYYLEVIKTKKKSPTNQFYWREVEKNKSYPDGINVLCFSLGYDTLQNATKMMKRNNKKRIVKLKMFYGDKEL